jgi:hypothetical protein
MASNHTPGPWNVWQHPGYPKVDVLYITHGYEEIATVYGGGRDIDWCRANASLISAAPDLLGALKALYALVLGECPSLLEDDHHDTMVRAAITKAESLK